MEAVRVDGMEIAPKVIAAEMQYHPARSRDDAWNKAATALVLRHLLLAEAGRLGITNGLDASDEAGAEEAVIQALLLHEVSTPVLDEATCRRYWSANQSKYRAPDLYEAAHILFPAALDDDAARGKAKQAAEETLALLQQNPTRFSELARERSACPSAASGGLLGQQTRGDLVPEIETFIFGLEEGQICPVPVATRYGYHVLRLGRLVHGETLSFAAARPLIERHLATQSWQRAVSQYLRLLVGRTRIEGLAITGAATPLVQ